MIILGAVAFPLLLATTGLAPATPDDGWKPLFDGTSLKGWHGYKSQVPPAGWTVENGTLVRSADGGDIVTDGEFGDFELSLEWKISEGGNSGIFYRALESTGAIWHNSPEYQVLDNGRHKDGASSITAAGSCYALYPPVKDVTRPAGEWNETRVVARGKHVEHWLNGTKLLQYEIGSEDWKTRVAASKFKVYPGFAEQPKGRIGLQDHGNLVWYRNIRIRELS